MNIKNIIAREVLILLGIIILAMCWFYIAFSNWGINIYPETVRGYTVMYTILGLLIRYGIWFIFWAIRTLKEKLIKNNENGVRPRFPTYIDALADFNK